MCYVKGVHEDTNQITELLPNYTVPLNCTENFYLQEITVAAERGP